MVCAAATAAVLVALLGGCSGGGGAVPADPDGGYLADQATVALVCLRWLPVLFPEVLHGQGDGCQPTDPEVTPNPDGTLNLRYRRSDCAEVQWVMDPTFLSGHAVVLYPDGGRETQAFELTPQPDGSAEVTEQRTFPDGARAETTITVAPWTAGDDPLLNTQQGRLFLPDGRTMDFRRQEYMKRSELSVDAHEGWTFDVQTPNVPGQTLPDLAATATGSLSHSPEALTFALEATSPAAGFWDIMRVQTPSGLSGLFQLDDALKGRGTVREREQVAITLSWDVAGRVRATYADGRTASGAPSAAARDFLVDQWLWRLGEFGPSPR